MDTSTRVSLAGVDLSGPTARELLAVLVEAIIGADNMYFHQPPPHGDQISPHYTIAKIHRFLDRSGYGSPHEEAEAVLDHLMQLTPRRLKQLRAAYRLSTPTTWGDLEWQVGARLASAQLGLPDAPPAG